MRVRLFGLVLIVLAAVVPLATFAYVSVSTSESTATDEVRTSSEELARSIASRITAYSLAHRDQLVLIGAAALRSDSPESVIQELELSYRHLTALSVFAADGTLVAGPGAGEYGPLVQRALAGESAISSLVPPGDGPVFGHTEFMAEPVIVAGQRVGAIGARVDLLHTWEPVEAVRVGDAGYVRLLAADGTILAHGDPEERRSVFAEPNVGETTALLAAARSGTTATNDQGIEVVASAAAVPGRDWVVIVERPVSEAFAAAVAMKRNLIYLSVGAVLFAILLGVIGGRPLVKSLERLRAHTKILGRGELDQKIDTKGPVVEVTELAQALNDMAASIQTLHDEAKARERLSTFARVAAGLAHDLRQPIETVRAACSDMLADPNDESARELFEFMTENELPRLRRYMEDLQRIAHEGDIQLQPDDIAPLELAESIANDLKQLPKWRGVEFSAAGRAQGVIADRNLLRRAIYNLAVNASDACSSNGPGGRVTLEVADAADGGAVEFRVRDNGSGIAPDALARLLEGDFHSTKRSTGVGLGFGVARHVAHAHGGRIEAVSEVGVGSTFVVRVPLVPGSDNGMEGSDAEIGGDRVVGPASHATH